MHRDVPYLAREQTKGKIIDRDVHTSRSQHIDATSQICLVIERVDPQQILIGEREARVFQAHQRDVVDKRQITRQPSAGFSQPSCGDGMKNNAHLDAPTLVLEPENSEHRIIEGAGRLNHVVVHGVNGAVKRDPSCKPLVRNAAQAAVTSSAANARPFVNT